MRLNDNAALYHALKADKPVLPIFIFDKNILDKLEDKKDRRVEFIHNVLSEIQTELQKIGSTILVKYGTPEEILPAFTIGKLSHCTITLVGVIFIIVIGINSSNIIFI